MTDERRGGINEGIRTGFGILTALKEAVEETLEEAVERGDLSPERARATMRDAAARVQTSFDEVRDRLEPVSRKEFAELQQEVLALRRRLESLEGGGEARDAGDTDRPEGGTIPVD